MNIIAAILLGLGVVGVPLGSAAVGYGVAMREVVEQCGHVTGSKQKPELLIKRNGVAFGIKCSIFSIAVDGSKPVLQ